MNKENSKPKILKYQTNAIDFALEFLSENSIFNLQSPTGSGKTFIIANLIDKYLENSVLNSKQTTFIFMAPSDGKLDYQGYEKISSYLSKDWVKGYTTNYIGTSNNKTLNKSYLQSLDYFKPNNVYFFGWSMFKRGGRIVDIDSEKNNIYRVIKNTHKKNVNIVLIVDEAHLNYGKDDNLKKEIIEELNPYKIIRVSATLEETNKHVDYRINYNDVIDECAIKKMVEINGVDPNINKIENYHENEQLIWSAIEKQKEIKKEYAKNNINIKPLIIIQIPTNIVIDEEIDSEVCLLNKIISFLEKKGYKKQITFAIWLDKIKTNSKEEIVDNNSTIEILIFKQAISIGWDVPRANILVRIRESKSSSFNIQTLGRILRNPFFNFYDNNLIDNAFVFTRDNDYKKIIKQEYISIDNETKVFAKRSKKSKDSNFSIDKILIDSNINNDELINFVSDAIISNNDFLNFFKYNNPTIDVKNIVINSKDILYNSDFTIDNLKKEIVCQKENKLKPVNSKESLIDLYIRFKTITKSNYLISIILEAISLKINIINKKIKEFYLSCINNWNRSIFKTGNNLFNLYEKIIQLINNYQNRNIEYKREAFNLPKEYMISSEIFSIDDWDKVNTYNIFSINIDKAFDSNVEKEFYKLWKNVFFKIDEIHIFRNGISNKDYYINYIDEFNKVRKFYPDFIVVNEIKKTVFVLEAKGRNEKDIDKSTFNKINFFKKLLNNKLIKSDTNYDIIGIFKVTLLNCYDIEIIDEENSEVYDIHKFKKIILN